MAKTDIADALCSPQIARHKIVLRQHREQHGVKIVSEIFF
jgi:hypothetical protein